MILLGINELFLFGAFQQVIDGQQFGVRPISETVLIVITGLTLLLTFLFINFRLDTIIKRDRIYIRFFPFHITFKHYN